MYRKILIVASGGKGIINPALEFANRLLKMGVHVTFCTGFSAVQRINKKTSGHCLTFAPFSDGIENSQQSTTTPQQMLIDFATNGACAVAEIISSAVVTGAPFDHLVYTTAVPWAATMADEHGVKSSLLWCQATTIMDIYYYYFNGYEGLISSNKNNPTFSINLPGLLQLTMADLPSFLSTSTPRELDSMILQVFKDHINVLNIAPRILAC